MASASRASSTRPPARCSTPMAAGPRNSAVGHLHAVRLRQRREQALRRSGDDQRLARHGHEDPGPPGVGSARTSRPHAPAALDPLQRLRVTGDITANYEYGTAAFGPAATVANFNGDVVLANDGSATPTQGCAASPAGAYTGKVVIIDRGTCAFEIKTVNAQNAGATEVIIANNAAGRHRHGRGCDRRSRRSRRSWCRRPTATAIKAELPGVNADDLRRFRASLPARIPADARCSYAPVTVATGSTFSHYDISHSRQRAAWNRRSTPTSTATSAST